MFQNELEIGKRNKTLVPAFKSIRSTKKREKPHRLGHIFKISTETERKH